MTSRIRCGVTVLVTLTTALLGAQAPNSPNGRVLPSDDDIRQAKPAATKRIEIALGHTPQARIDIATELRGHDVGTRRAQQRHAPSRAGTHSRAGRQVCERGPLARHEGIARVRAGQNGR